MNQPFRILKFAQLLTETAICIDINWTSGLFTVCVFVCVLKMYKHGRRMYSMYSICFILSWYCCFIPRLYLIWWYCLMHTWKESALWLPVACSHSLDPVCRFIWIHPFISSLAICQLLRRELKSSIIIPWVCLSFMLLLSLPLHHTLLSSLPFLFLLTPLSPHFTFFLNCSIFFPNIWTKYMIVSSGLQSLTVSHESWLILSLMFSVWLNRQGGSTPSRPDSVMSQTNTFKRPIDSICTLKAYFTFELNVNYSPLFTWPLLVRSWPSSVQDWVPCNFTDYNCYRLLLWRQIKRFHSGYD